MQHRTTTPPRAASRRATEPETAPLTVALPARPAARRSPAALRRRPALYVGVAAAGAVLVNVFVGVEPAAQAEAGTSESVAVAQALGLTAQSAPATVAPDLQPLSELAASRGDRAAAAAAAAQVQAAADQAELDRRRAEAEAAAAAAAAAAAQAAAEAEAAAAAEAEAAAAEEAEEAEASSGSSGSSGGGSAAAAGSTAVTAVARISNTAGPVASRVQAAADATVSNVPGAGAITIGGTRPSATDPGGHPSGKALDWMVQGDQALGQAIIAYSVANWDALGIEYLIYRQRILQSPGGSWSTMADRGSATANHMDHVHINYR